MRRFIYARLATNIRDWSLAYSFICLNTRYADASLLQNNLSNNAASILKLAMKAVSMEKERLKRDLDDNDQSLR